MFNNREGFTRNDDDLPKRYYDEKIPDGYTPKGKIISKEDFERLLDEYYKLHGWDDQGIPKKDTLQKLGLEKEPTRLL
jgi:aldehyde:ferredoxin oxidoreductase